MPSRSRRRVVASQPPRLRRAAGMDSGLCRRKQLPALQSQNLLAHHSKGAPASSVRTDAGELPADRSQFVISSMAFTHMHSNSEHIKTMGLHYVATGERYLAEAVASRKSAKVHMPDVPAVIFTDL